MGKLGGRELNYSSDIDLRLRLRAGRRGGPGAHARVPQARPQAVSPLMTEFTRRGLSLPRRSAAAADGRDAATSPTRCSQHRQYYDTWGETFERFALIKASPIAGDRRLGRRFLDAGAAVRLPAVSRSRGARRDLPATRNARSSAQRRRASATSRSAAAASAKSSCSRRRCSSPTAPRMPALREASTLRALGALPARADSRRGAPRRPERARTCSCARSSTGCRSCTSSRPTRSRAPQQELEICARRLGLADAGALEAELDAAARPRARDLRRAVRAAARDLRFREPPVLPHPDRGGRRRRRRSTFLAGTTG